MLRYAMFVLCMATVSTADAATEHVALVCKGLARYETRDLDSPKTRKVELTLSAEIAVPSTYDLKLITTTRSGDQDAALNFLPVGRGRIKVTLGGVTNTADLIIMMQPGKAYNLRGFYIEKGFVQPPVVVVVETIRGERPYRFTLFHSHYGDAGVLFLGDCE